MASAQTFTGPSKCVGCHDHERQANKWQKEEPATLGAKAHFRTLKQLDGPKSVGFAKAIGLTDPYDIKGACVKCHGTVFRGDASAGVSCESCHGAASGYNDLHQVKGSYAKAVAAGMRDLKDKTASIAKVCVDCHITSDKRLGAAGHPTGATFDAGVNLQKIVHWNTAYNFAQVTAAGKAAGAGRLTAGGPPVAPTGAPPVGNPPVKGGPPATTGTVATGPSPAPPVKGAAQATAPAPPPPPWDWDQPVQPLPADYVPETVPSPAPPSAEGLPAKTRARPVPIAPSLAEDSPLPSGTALTKAQAGPDTAAVAAGTGAASPPSGPPSAAAQVVSLRGEGVLSLEKLLRAGARVPALPAAAKPDEFKGPDAELLRLQDEVLALAIEALRRPKP